ncbi:MAG: 16S rRNA (guanine(966)-N(2))-methyltransferase RsmD [Cyanobacteriota bacterium]|nr:16S rRNA (guanine(966)-N(2))-methyltransferase RsmD [Cyanobacteriota bacterium]
MSLRLSGGRKLLSPPGDRARPTPSRVRLAVFNMLAARVSGCRWLDLCSGSGVMACEALQHGAAAVVAVEQDRRIAQVVRANLTAVAAGLGSAAGQWQVHGREVLQWLRSSPPTPFDLIYCDPPYASGLYNALAETIRQQGWLNLDGLLLFECGSERCPELPEGWDLCDRRRYGGTTVLVLSCRAGCRGDTDSRRP